MIFSFLYVFVFSIALVLIQKLDVDIPPLFSLLITASLATIYFNLINLNDLKKIYLECISNIKEWIWVMLIVLVMWATTMIGPAKIGASQFNFIYFAWLGILGFISLSYQNWSLNKNKFYFAICLLTLILGAIYIELQLSLSLGTIYGLLLALLGGTASFVYFKKSQILANKAELTATQVLAVRFYLAIIILTIFLPKHASFQYLTLSNLISLSLLACFSLIIPLYFSQKALEKISSEQHAIINSLCPIVTGILQELMFRDLKCQQIIVYLLYSISIASFYLIEKMNKQYSHFNLYRKN